jgi:hypothetical protein
MYSSITEGLAGELEQIRADQEAAIEGVKTETGAALEEQKGWVESLFDGISETLDSFGEQLAGLVGRVGSLETETADLSATLESETERLAGLITTEETGRKSQALIVADMARLQAAQAAALASLMQFGGGVLQSHIDRAIDTSAKAYDLTAIDRERLRTWVQSVGTRLQQNQGSLGGPGLGFLSPLINGPMGTYVGSAFGSIPLEKNPAPPRGESTWGVKLS